MQRAHCCHFTCVHHRVSLYLLCFLSARHCPPSAAAAAPSPPSPIRATATTAVAVPSCCWAGFRTVRLWHLSRPQCLAVLEFPAGYGTPYVAYDQQGLVFAAATSTGKANIIKLYDARNVRMSVEGFGAAQREIIVFFFCCASACAPWGVYVYSSMQYASVSPWLQDCVFSSGVWLRAWARFLSCGWRSTAEYVVGWVRSEE